MTRVGHLLSRAALQEKTQQISISSSRPPQGIVGDRDKIAERTSKGGIKAQKKTKSYWKCPSDMPLGGVIRPRLSSARQTAGLNWGPHCNHDAAVKRCYHWIPFSPPLFFEEVPHRFHACLAVSCAQPWRKCACQEQRPPSHSSPGPHSKLFVGRSEAWTVGHIVNLVVFF